MGPTGPLRVCRQLPAQVGKLIGGLPSPWTDMLYGPVPLPIRLLIVAIAFTVPPGKGLLGKLDAIMMSNVVGNDAAAPVVTTNAVVVRSTAGKIGGPEALIISEEKREPVQERVSDPGVAESLPVQPAFNPVAVAVATMLAWAGWARSV